MGWKGSMRTGESIIRGIIRDSQRAAKEREKQAQYENAVYAVQEQQEFLNELVSFHKEINHQINWNQKANSPPPTKPTRSNISEQKVRQKIEKPNFFVKLFRRQEKNKNKWAARLEGAIAEDEKRFKKALKDYNAVFKSWENEVTLAKSILSGDVEAYIEAFDRYQPCSRIANIGKGLKINAYNPRLINVNLMVHGEDQIPNETYNVLKSGKLSIKATPRSRFYEIYQDYISSAVLRIGREFLAFLPVEGVIVTAVGNLLNKKTGHLEDLPILSVYFPKETMEQINFPLIDPSDSLKNFLHNMDFKKTTGFNPVERIDVNFITPPNK